VGKKKSKCNPVKLGVPSQVPASQPVCWWP